MTAPIAYHQVALPHARPSSRSSARVRTCGLDHSLPHLVTLRASDMNGCAYCVDMRTKDARQGGAAAFRAEVGSYTRGAAG